MALPHGTGYRMGPHGGPWDDPWHQNIRHRTCTLYTMVCMRPSTRRDTMGFLVGYYIVRNNVAMGHIGKRRGSVGYPMRRWLTS